MQKIWDTDVAAIRFSPACGTVHDGGITYSVRGFNESSERTNQEIYTFVKDLGIPEDGFLTLDGEYYKC